MKRTPICCASGGQRGAPLWKPFLLGVILFCSVSPTLAAETDLFAEPCAKFQVPQALALAIADQESGMHPWAVNIEGKSYFPGSKKEALALIAAKGTGRSYDVGLMQVNSWWLRKFGVSPELALEPVNNVYFGCFILGREIKRHGLNWKAVASYHTPLARNPARGRNYAASVLNHLKEGK